MKRIIITTAIIILATAAAHAATPTLINYQGYMKESGVAVTAYAAAWARSASGANQCPARITATSRVSANGSPGGRQAPISMCAILHRGRRPVNIQKFERKKKNQA